MSQIINSIENLHSAIQADRIPPEFANHRAATYHQSDLLTRIINIKSIAERLGSQNTHLIELSEKIDLIKPKLGPRKNGNPEFPMSNLVTCDSCKDKSNGRLVGFKHSNGKNNALVYYKYRCRSCKKYQHRDEIHEQISILMQTISLTPSGQADLLSALDSVWKQQEDQSEQDTIRLKHAITQLRRVIESRVESAIDPSNISIKENILASIEEKKRQLEIMELELDNLSGNADRDKQKFMAFALRFVETVGAEFFNISKENRLRCKQLLFPAGFYVDKNKKVYTPEISPLYRLATKKKDTEVSMSSHLVRVRGL